METNTPGNNKRINVENLKLAESIGNVRALLISILCDEFSSSNSTIGKIIKISISKIDANTFS